MNPSHHQKYWLIFFLIIFIIWSIGTLIFWSINIFAYIGSTLIMMGDYITNTFTIIGIKKPEIGWLLLGCLVGGILGLIQGLKQTGRYSDLYKIYLVAAVMVLTFQGVAYFQWQSKFDISDFQKVVLKENFVSPQGWRLSDGALIKQGGLFQFPSPINSPNWSMWENQGFSDVDYSAEVTKANGSDSVYFGLLARVSEQIDSSFYYLKINGDGNYAMGKYEKGQWENRVGGRSTDLIDTGNGKNRLRIVCKNNLIIGFINNIMVGFFIDYSYRYGKIAVYSGRVEEKAVGVYFDNILVKEKLDQEG